MALPSIFHAATAQRVLFVVLAGSAVILEARARAEEPVLAQAPGPPGVRTATPQGSKAPNASNGPKARPAPPPAAPAAPSAELPEVPSPEPAEAAPSEAPPPDAADAPLEADPALELAQPTRTPNAANEAAKRELQKRFQELQRERASTSNLLPWVTVAAGSTIALVATAVGAANAFDCEPDTNCAAPPWAALAVVAGAAIGTAGAVWLVHKNADIRELESKTHQLQLDLERLEFARTKRTGIARLGASGPQVSMRVSF